MKFTTKAMLLISVISGTTIAAGAVLSDSSIMTIASDCSHEGNHYDALSATQTSSGTKEYWVCCKCHEHYLTKPSGNWTDAGVAAQINDENDNRYIPFVGQTDAQGLTYSADGKTILSCDGTAKNIVIPEGVTTIAEGVFVNKDLTSVVLPSTIESVPAKAFYDTEIASSIGGNSTNDIVIYLNMTKEEIDAKVASGEFAKDWDVAYTSSPLGLGWFGKQDHKAELCYANEWHYDENGNPVKNS